MAATQHGNIIHCDGAEALWTARPTKVRLIQWIDNNGDLVHDSTLVLTLNGTTLTVKIQPLANALGFGATAWQIGPFNPGFSISDFTITTMATGELHVWID